MIRSTAIMTTTDKGESSTADDDLGRLVTKLSLNSEPVSLPSRILCDMGYGLPKEGRPRKEKVNAISRQLVNFLWWQIQHKLPLVSIDIVDCPDDDAKKTLSERMKSHWEGENKKSGTNEPFPEHVQFIEQSLEDLCHPINNRANNTTQDSDTVYLSPDAPRSLDPSQPPPHVLVVGLLIDRRIQLNRSLERANKIDIKSAQLPLSDAGIALHVEGSNDATNSNEQEPSFFESSEPLNVDCVLEMIQQWHWNSQAKSPLDPTEQCHRALFQAIQHHAQRHPSRTQHNKS